MMRIVWSPRALKDYEDILAFIAEESPQNALLVEERILKSVALLTNFQFGQAGPVSGTYKHLIPKSSHFVVYRFRGKDALEIIALVHTARDWTLMKWIDTPDA